MFLKVFLAILAPMENRKLILALINLTGAPITIANKATGTLRLGADKTRRVFSISSNATIYFTEYFIHFFSLANSSREIFFYSVSFIKS